MLPDPKVSHYASFTGENGANREASFPFIFSVSSVACKRSGCCSAATRRRVSIKYPGQLPDGVSRNTASAGGADCLTGDSRGGPSGSILDEPPATWMPRGGQHHLRGLGKQIHRPAAPESRPKRRWNRRRSSARSSSRRSRRAQAVHADPDRTAVHADIRGIEAEVGSLPVRRARGLDRRVRIVVARAGGRNRAPRPRSNRAVRRAVAPSADHHRRWSRTP